MEKKSGSTLISTAVVHKALSVASSNIEASNSRDASDCKDCKTSETGELAVAVETINTMDSKCSRDAVNNNSGGASTTL